jgi:hypothetical protein
MFKMVSNDPFGHLKHKLWPKEGLGVKLAIWLPTTKSQESTWFPCVQVTCDIFLESSQWGLQLCFNPLSQSEVYTQSYGAPKLRKSQLWEFWDSHLGVPRQNVIWMWALWRGTKYTIRGKVVVSPKSGLWWVLWVQVCMWFVLIPKVFQLCINQLVVWFCPSPVSSWCLHSS